MSSAGYVPYETQNYDLLCSVKLVVVDRDLLWPEAVFDDRFFYASVVRLSCCVMVAPLFAS